MSISMGGMTLAEAYLLRKKDEGKYNRGSKSSRKEGFVSVTNMNDLELQLRKVVCILEDNSPGATRTAIANLKEIPGAFDQHVTAWHDQNNLDIFHHAIINNKHDLLSFLLTETKYFPPGHVPTSNPYAHLAALLGHADCLKVILQQRPSAFFKCDKPNHAMKLPDNVIKKNKLNESAKAVTKTAEKILEKIKCSTKDEESKMQNQTDTHDSDVTSMLDKELGALEKSFGRSKRAMPKLSVSKEKIKRRSISKDTRNAMTEVVQKKAPKYTLTCKAGNGETDEDFNDHFRRRAKTQKGEHLFTIFWDALPCIEPGVIRGVGRPVVVKRGPEAHLDRSHVDLDRINFNVPSAKSSMMLPPTGKKRIPRSLTLSTPKASSSSLKSIKAFEVGVRGTKKYKDFHLKPNPHFAVEKDESEKYMNKTPLTFAAERGHFECVQLILDTVVIKRNPSIANREPLTLATKARSPEAIMLLLERRTSRTDFQSAVMMAIREMYPDCLTALLTNKSKDRQNLFDGTNLFHILYSQSVISSKRYELMPEMTRALISSKEDVNAHGAPRTYPMYTLINCAFNITVGKQIFFFIDCLHILLECKANPHFDEEKPSKAAARTDVFSRQPFSSAISCVFESAKNSVNFFESSYWSKLFMKKFITTIEMWDMTARRVLNHILFDYMDAVCTLGLDRTIVRCLLRYGANPDFKKDGKYPVNVYFDELLPYLTRFEVMAYDRYRQELATLNILCRHMSNSCLTEALQIFLSDHLLSAPLQALAITREFASLMDQLLRTPRPLAELTALAIWLQTRRNKKRVKTLPLSDGFIALIIP